MNFAFFWVGKDISIPSYLVRSIRHIYKDEAYIYYLTDNSTPNIDGVNKTLRKILPKPIMLARLKAYCLINTHSPTCFLDADSLLLAKVDLPDFNGFKAFIIERDDKLSKMNTGLSQTYPEFYKNKIYDLMPIFFGFIATPNGGKFFLEAQKVLLSLPRRYHEWFGDQFALAELWRKDPENYLLLQQNEFLHIIDKQLSLEELENLINLKVKIITFKGSHSKSLIKETLEEVLKF